MSIRVDSTSTTRQTMAVAQFIPQYRQTEGQGRRKLLTTDEVLRLPNEELLCIIRGCNVLRLKSWTIPGTRWRASWKGHQFWIIGQCSNLLQSLCQLHQTGMSRSRHESQRPACTALQSRRQISNSQKHIAFVRTIEYNIKKPIGTTGKERFSWQKQQISMPALSRR